MTRSKPYTRSMVGGVVSPSMVGRIDDANRDTGLASCRNMIILPEGIATSRPGLRYVNASKYPSKRVRMIPFRYSSTQTTAVEFGETYIRFHTYGATLLTPTSGVSAWDSVPTYNAGSLVTYGGATWYAVTDVPANQQPDLNEWEQGEPIVSATWVDTTGQVSTPPPGYTYVGTELPSRAQVGLLVYLSMVVYEYIVTEIGMGPDGIPYYTEDYVPVLRYVGYTGTAGVSTPSTYWYRLGTYYEIPSPYAEAHLMDLHYVQSGDVLTITHPQYQPRELRRNDTTTWFLVPIDFGSDLSAPTISGVTPTTASSPSDTQTYSYVATNVSDDQQDESVQSSEVTATNQLADTGAYNTITFGGAARRNVYRLSGGLYGFIGQTVTTSLVDDNIAPDVSRTPPLNQDPFATDWPAAVTYFGQRRAFGGTPNLPQAFWLTKVGTESNLDYSIPVRDEDAITIKIAAREASNIRHLVPLSDLIILTSSAEFRVGSDGPLTSTSARRAPTQGFVGANNVQPVVVDQDLIFAAARGGHLRGLGYNFQRAGYVSEDISLRAPHLFDFKTIVDMAFTRAPTPIVWCVSSNGDLVSLTYVPSEQVKAYHTHYTDGYFESICAVAEGDEDIIYASVQRAVGDETVRYIECFSTRFYTRKEDAFFVDCGLTYDGSETDTITGLDHLVGYTVSILADGAVQAPREVAADGSITLDLAASVVQVGLPLIRELRTLPVAVDDVSGFGQGDQKNLVMASVRVLESGAYGIGSDVDNLQIVPARTTENWGSPPTVASGYQDTSLGGNWNDEGQMTILAADPTPLTVASFTKEVEFGG